MFTKSTDLTLTGFMSNNRRFTSDDFIDLSKGLTENDLRDESVSPFNHYHARTLLGFDSNIDIKGLNPMDFGDYCECCGINLNVINDSNHGLCNNCDSRLTDRFTHDTILFQEFILNPDKINTTKIIYE